MALKPPRPWWLSAILSVSAGTALSLGGIVLMGIPGALLASPALEISRIFVDIPENPFPRESAWPYVLIVSLLWGLAVPAMWMGTRAMELRGLRRGVVVTLGVVAIGIAIATALYLTSVVALYPEAGVHP